MNHDQDPSTGARQRRQQATARVPSQPPADVAPGTVANSFRLLHELEVQLIEIELQEEELCAARAQLEAGLERYTSLYEHAPMGLFSVARDSSIQILNRAGAALLGSFDDRLLNSRFADFVAGEDQVAFLQFLRDVFEQPDKRSCVVSLQLAGRPRCIVAIEATPSLDGRECRFIVTDITLRKQAENEIRARISELLEWQKMTLGNDDHAG